MFELQTRGSIVKPATGNILKHNETLVLKNADMTKLLATLYDWSNNQDCKFYNGPAGSIG
jgi:hypothetical protein